MRQILALLLLAVLQNTYPAPGPGRQSRASSGVMAVVHAYNSCGSTANFAGSTTCTITPAGAGNSLLVIYNIGGGAAPTSISPSCTSTLPGLNTGYGYNGACLISNAGGATSVKITYSSNYTIASILIVEVSGLLTSGASDASVGFASGAYSGTNNTGNPGTTSNANDAIVGLANPISSSGGEPSPGTGFTVLGYSNYATAAPVWAEFENVSGTGSSFNPAFGGSFQSPTIATWALKY